MTSQTYPQPQGSRLLPVTDRLSRLPYWLLAAILLAVYFLWVIATNGDYQVIFSATVKGMGTTIYVTLIAYTVATLLGLVMGLLRLSKRRVIQEASRFYVEIVRGIPMLVILYYIAFVGAPTAVDALNWLGRPLIDAGWIEPLNVRQVNFTVRAILALSIGYSAFIAEIFRAGIQSVDRGQVQAAMALGMGSRQTMLYVVLPQAIRNVLPPRGGKKPPPAKPPDQAAEPSENEDHPR